ncbi:MAG: exopolysaccharide biosynthesis polyprenyl glycosylphosphotransferase [Alphaproteobacteria bacterium]|nr:exopolysaccharide biosynthesis polyprenyl glycosylphosphotransferase [Alphaproteobacteria bacterium]
MNRPARPLAELWPLLGRLASDAVGLVLAGLIAFVLAGLISEYGRGVPYLNHTDATLSRHVIMFGLFGALTLFTFWQRGHYTQRLPWWYQVRELILVLLAIMLVQGFVHYSFKYPLSRLWVGGTWVLAIPSLMILRLCYRNLCRRLGRWGVKTLVVGGQTAVLETLYALHADRYADYQVDEIVLLRDGKSRDTLAPKELPERYRHAQVKFGLAAAKVALAHHRFVVLAPDERSSEGVGEFLREVTRTHTDYALVPPTLSFTVYGAKPQYFFGHNVVLLAPPRSGRPLLERLAKRALDVVGAAVGLLLLAPLFAVIAMLIKRQNPGSRVFFSHTRVGQHGRPFPCWKFTSMVPNAEAVLQELLSTNPAAKAEWECDFKLKDDPRITRIGAFLRKTSLDELPQLWNVLKGEMSLVGPRPIVTAEQAYYGDKLDYYLGQKPGITGLWQVSGRNDTTYTYRVYLDEWYAHHGSFWHDVVILFETIGILLNRKGAY